jgi:glycerophosphoryl diester phosphodiesterase
MRIKIFFCFFFALLFTACASKKVSKHRWQDDPEGYSTRFNKSKILIVAHRGLSGHYPEHTLESYAQAIEAGADYIEPDLVSTKDGVLIARHENDMGHTTDVATKFPERKTKKSIDGRDVEGFFSEDFTLKEVKQLRAVQPFSVRDQQYNGKFEIPTFEEILKLAVAKSKEKGRRIGVYVEVKNSTYFRSIKKPIEEKMLALLNKYGYKSKDDPVFIQSFEITNLKELNKKTSIRLLQLLDEPDWRPFDHQSKGLPTTFQDMTTPEALKEIATYADAVGPWKRLIVLEDKDKNLLPANNFIRDAHAVGLLVHAYTFRSDKKYLNAAYEGNPENEYHHFFKLGVDGIFTDFTDDAVPALKSFTLN